MNRTTEKHLAALDGVEALARLGIDLSKLSNDELDRLEMLAGAWPDDGRWSPPPRFGHA